MRPPGKAETVSMQCINRTTGKLDKAGAFTLLELLVVIAVIALLLAVLLPSLRKAKQISASLVCKSNLRNIALQWHVYLGDNDDRFFQEVAANYRYGGCDGKAYAGISRPLNPYLSLPLVGASNNEAKVFKCPSDDGRLMPFGMVYYDIDGTSYQMNLFLTQKKVTLPHPELTSALNEKLPDLRASDVDMPSELIMLGDSEWGTQWMSVGREGVPWHHKEQHYNVAFMDGHVEFPEIHKGKYVGPNYRVIPFIELCGLALSAQQPEEP